MLDEAAHILFFVALGLGMVNVYACFVDIHRHEYLGWDVHSHLGTSRRSTQPSDDIIPEDDYSTLKSGWYGSGGDDDRWSAKTEETAAGGYDFSQGYPADDENIATEPLERDESTANRHRGDGELYPEDKDARETGRTTPPAGEGSGEETADGEEKEERSLLLILLQIIGEAADDLLPLLFALVVLAVSSVGNAMRRMRGDM